MSPSEGANVSESASRRSPGRNRGATHQHLRAPNRPRAPRDPGDQAADDRRLAAEKIVITISAAFGAGGSMVGKALAARLGIPFMDGAIAPDVAHSFATDVRPNSQADERVIGRFLAERGGLASPRYITEAGFTDPHRAATCLPPELWGNEAAFRRENERLIREMASNTGGVIRGRAGVVILQEWPGALHVHLDGPMDARLRRAAAMSGEDEMTVTAKMIEFESAQSAYLKHFYHVDPRDSRLYHITLDATAIEFDTAVDLIAAAAVSRSTGD
jgi:cytidylate kinase